LTQAAPLYHINKNNRDSFGRCWTLQSVDGSSAMLLPHPQHFSLLFSPFTFLFFSFLFFSFLFSSFLFFSFLFSFLFFSFLFFSFLFFSFLFLILFFTWSGTKSCILLFYYSIMLRRMANARNKTKRKKKEKKKKQSQSQFYLHQIMWHAEEFLLCIAREKIK
jgi:hypothetical protein